MWKKYKVIIIITAIICLLPMIAGLILWNQLPEQIPTHWGINGEPDGWSSKAVAVFGFPLLIAGLQLICCFAGKLDKAFENQPKQLSQLMLWICPVLSLVLNSLTYAIALGYDLLNVSMLMSLLFGALFVVIGNYMPKCRQNQNLGIRIPWTLADEGNWNATHRLGGWVWMISGVVLLATAFLGTFIIFVVATLFAILVPIVYSYIYYRKHKSVKGAEQDG